MNPNEFHQMYKHLIKPSREKIVESAKKELGIPKEAKINNGSEILEWIHFNQKMYGDNKMPLTDEERKTGEKIEKIIAGGNVTPPKKKKEKNGWRYTSFAEAPHGTEPDDLDPKELDSIKKELQVSPMVKKPKKKIIKKEIKVVEKPRPTIQEQLDFQDHLNELDPYWWIEDIEEPKAKRITVKDKKIAEGIRSILNLHKRQT